MYTAKSMDDPVGGWRGHARRWRNRRAGNGLLWKIETGVWRKLERGGGNGRFLRKRDIQRGKRSREENRERVRLEREEQAEKDREIYCTLIFLAQVCFEPIVFFFIYFLFWTFHPCFLAVCGFLLLLEGYRRIAPFWNVLNIDPLLFLL